MAAPKGNNYNMKWKTKEERQAACDALCKTHFFSGLSRGCFDLADWDTVERYMKDFPEDFPPEKIAKAVRDNKKVWETIGLDGAMGKINGFNATSWIFNMKNRFKDEWKDKQEHDHQSSDGSMKPTVVQLVGKNDNSED